MLNTLNRLPEIITSFVLIFAIVVGSTMGYVAPEWGTTMGNWVDYTLLALVSVLFFGVRFGALFKAVTNLRFLGIALFANFLVVPVIGYGIASLFLSSHPLFVIGLVIYFMSPCTDWFLSFTRLSKGNVALGTALIPVNMVAQLLLYPFLLQWFTHNTVQFDAAVIGSTLLQWFLLPLLGAVVVRQVLQFVLKNEWFERILMIVDDITPWITAVLIVQIFAGNVQIITAHLDVFVWVLLAVFSFFVLTFLLSEALSYAFSLEHPEYALLTMSVAARNAPMMLALTMAALPNQPLIYAALVIGMLVEFPHLTALRRILLSNRWRLSHNKLAESARPE